MLRRLVVDRRVIAAIIVVVSFRYSIGVFEPLWATYLDELGASTMVVTISLTVFALPMLLIAKPAGRLSDAYGGRVVSVLAAAATVPLMAAYGYVGLVPIVMVMAIPHGVLEAIQSPGAQSAVADAATARRCRRRPGSGRGRRLGRRGHRCVHRRAAVRRARRRTGVADRRRRDDRAADHERAARPPPLRPPPRPTARSLPAPAGRPI